MKCYSLNDEEFNYTELTDAVRDKFDDLSIKVGDVVTIYEADAVLYKAGDLIRDVLDSMQNASYDEGGEYAEDYLSGVTKEQELDLNRKVAEAVNQWADDHGLQPTFYRVKNGGEIKIKMLDDDGDFEVMP